MLENTSSSYPCSFSFSLPFYLRSLPSFLPTHLPLQGFGNTNYALMNTTTERSITHSCENLQLQDHLWSLPFVFSPPPWLSYPCRQANHIFWFQILLLFYPFLHHCYHQSWNHPHRRRHHLPHRLHQHLMPLLFHPHHKRTQLVNKNPWWQKLVAAETYHIFIKKQDTKSQQIKESEVIVSSSI